MRAKENIYAYTQNIFGRLLKKLIRAVALKRDKGAGVRRNSDFSVYFLELLKL